MQTIFFTTATATMGYFLRAGVFAEKIDVVSLQLPTGSFREKEYPVMKV